MKTYSKVILFLFVGLLTLHAENLRIEANILAKDLSGYTILDTRESSQFAQQWLEISSDK